MLIIGNQYSFEGLEKEISDADYIAVKILNLEYNLIGIMHIFSENFSKNYLSGEGVIFYQDGETHSANPWDQFKVLEIYNW